MSRRAESSVGPVEIRGNPTDAEVAAIVAAIELAWPPPAPPVTPPEQPTAWRYSGRWWSEGRLPRTWQVR